MKETPNPTSVHALQVQNKERLKPELQALLDKFEEAGYLTHKGTNSYVLANIIVDYTDRMIHDRLANTGNLSYWESQNIALVSLLAFDRYRIYNMRSTPAVYQAARPGIIGQQVMNAVYNTTDTVLQGKYHSINIPRHAWYAPINLNCQYQDLLSFAYLTTPDGKTYQESFMTSDGVYIEQDYYIVPDIKGNSYLHLINYPNKSEKIEYLNLVFLTTSIKEPEGIRLNTGLQITPDYLRFVTTELFGKFKTLTRMQGSQFQKFLTLKYNCDIQINGNDIIIPDFLPEDEIRDFADKHVLLPVKTKKWVIHQAQKMPIYAPDGLYQYLNKEINGLVTNNNDTIKYYVSKYYLDTYGVQGIKMQEEFIAGIKEPNGYVYCEVLSEVLNEIQSTI